MLDIAWRRVVQEVDEGENPGYCWRGARICLFLSNHLFISMREVFPENFNFIA